MSEVPPFTARNMQTIGPIVVLIADGTPDKCNEAITIDKVTWNDEYIRVTVSDGKFRGQVGRPIGRAQLARDGNNVVATLKLIENENVIGLYATVSGQSKGHTMDGEVKRLNDCEIFEIRLSHSTHDDRLKPIAP